MLGKMVLSEERIVELPVGKEKKSGLSGKDFLNQEVLHIQIETIIVAEESTSATVIMTYVAGTGCKDIESGC
jgi:hypothetical protein